MKKEFLIVLLICASVQGVAQKTVDGIKFGACLNHDLPRDFYRNKFLVLDFWATWCGPCIASFPRLDELRQKYGNDTNLVFASMTAESKGKADTFFKKKKDTQPGIFHLVDDRGTTWEYFDVQTIPLILVFAPSGKVVFSGRVEELSNCMGNVLKGENMLKETRPAKPVSDVWEKYKKTADYIAITGPSDTSDTENGHTQRNKDKVAFSFQHYSLTDVVSSISDLTAVQLKCSDSLKGKQTINLYYQQAKNSFPEFDKGILPEEYQNHIIHLLEQNFGFHSEWTVERTVAWKILVKDAKQLAEHVTISTKGSSGSRTDSKKKRYNFVNCHVKALAAHAEDALEVPVFSDDSTVTGYDVEVEFSSLKAFTESLAAYGLGLEKVEGHEIMKLNLIFDREPPKKSLDKTKSR